MKVKLDKDISVIVILYNTPINKIINLKQYKNFRLIILEQGSFKNSKKKIQKILGFEFRYFYSKKNLGLSKGINFLIKKTKTKYCMITEPDIFIDKTSILNLKKTIKLNKFFLMVGPNYKKKKESKMYKVLKNMDTSCVLFETKKMLKFNFYDEDFFFFWQDVDLIKRINSSKYEMVKSNNSFAKHLMSGSSNLTTNINFLRDKGYKYGELVFDFKHGKLRFIKILRQLVQSFIRTLFFITILKKKNRVKNFAYLIGILQFLVYYLRLFKFKDFF